MHTRHQEKAISMNCKGIEINCRKRISVKTQFFIIFINGPKRKREGAHQ